MCSPHILRSCVLDKPHFMGFFFAVKVGVAKLTNMDLSLIYTIVGVTKAFNTCFHSLLYSRLKSGCWKLLLFLLCIL